MTGARSRRRILFVCTANICRSATAELMARARFGEDRMVFRSAGFLEHGRPCPADLRAALAEIGIDARSHRSYLLDHASLDAADLVLTMEGQHVQRATAVAPDIFPRIVPLREAAAVLTEAPAPIALDAFLADLNRRRDPRSYLDARWDVADPYGGRLRTYRQAVAEIDELVTIVIGTLH